MSNLRLAFVIDAVDRATATVQRINKSIDRMTEPARRARAAIDGLLQTGGFNQARSAVAALTERTQDMIGAFRGVAAVVAGVGIAAGGAGFGLKRTIDSVDAMLDQAKKLNVPIEAYQRLGFAAKMNGSSQEEMGQGLQFLAQNMVGAINGSKELQEWFGRVGLSVAALKKMNSVQVFEAIADKFVKVGDAGQNAEKKIALLRALTGRGGAELKQMFDLGSEGLRGFYAQADKLGGVVGTDAAEAMADFNDSFDAMSFSLQGLKAVVASGALPALNQMVASTTAWAMANRALIATRVTAFIEAMLPRLPAITTSLLQIASALITVIALADQFAQAIGGWGTVIAIWAGVVLGKGLFALYGMATAIWGVGVAMWATPLGWWTAGILGVAALAALVYDKWEPISKFFKELWAGIIDGINSMDRLIPSWARLPDVGPGGRLVRSGPDAEPAVAAAPAPSAIAARGGPYRADVSGTLKIEFDDRGKPRVRELGKAPGGVLDFEAVYNGAVMAGS